MVSYAVWKTRLEGLSRQKPRPNAEVFVVTEAREPCFSHGMGDRDQILSQHVQWLILFPRFVHRNVKFSALKWTIYD